MKKYAIAIIAAMMIVASAFAAFASEYRIMDHYWDVNYTTGTVAIRWEKCEYTTKYKVEVFRKGLNSSKAGVGTKVLTKTITGTRLNITDTIVKKGTGQYSYCITPTYSPDPLDDMAVSDEEFEADSAFIQKIVKTSVDPNTPGSLTSYRWMKTPTGWAYQEGGVNVTNAWRLLGGFWYYFNGNGDMLTGWQKIGGRYYYLNPIEGQGGYPQGACWINGTTPDGYSVNGNGEWTVNGIPQAV